MPPSLHRLLTGSLLAGSAAVLTALGGVAFPAAAAPAAAASLHLYVPALTLAAGSPGERSAVAVWADKGASGVRKLHLSVDSADVADIVSITVDKDLQQLVGATCSTAGTVLTCTLPEPFVEGGGPEGAAMTFVPLQLTARAGAKAGAAGKLAFTAQADDGPVATYGSKVRIGEGVDLAAVQTHPVTIAPGAQGSADIRVSNAGTRPVDGAVLLTAGWSDRLLTGPGHRNCRYGIMVACTFDDTLAPGRTYALSEPVQLRMPTDAASGSSATAFGLWYTVSEWEDMLGEAGDGGPLLGTPGTGDPTRLQPIASAKGVPQVDTDPDNNFMLSEVVVGGHRKADMAAIGDTVAGSPGDRVKTRLGFVNNGPGTVYLQDFENTDPWTHVTVPSGLRAAEVDQQCFANSSSGNGEDDGDGAEIDEELGGQPGASDYVCLAETDVAKPGERVLFDFTFQIEQKSHYAAGSVSLNDEKMVGRSYIDGNARNDATKITVNVTGGSGGGLPVTGTRTGLVAAAGALLLLAGGGGVLLARRRRVRFAA